MESATSDTRKVIKYAFSVLARLYREGYEYKKAGIKLSGIVPKTEAQMGLFDKPDSEKDESLMKSMDAINARDGSNTLKSAACGVDNKAWAMNRHHKSPRFVTGWSELPRVK
jgi:DNA polymerase V